ncbi:intracellular short-chain-length polyhydroxyalkanoate depolymerase [Jeotgalibacillus terrae]|uniref:Alpha/beta fold hydrolase n=1 Tax=Jeotgalibacillus terrae TaxID=587735 RepID=A0ABW5ZL35_9BACL|nr:alpha/beta hydrolase [Jeotgalibacillus terrae]MBM7579674.1 pimeloyl-ACP methyl ester carboxylesterase [Jeotgalibacillus terrae]
MTLKTIHLQNGEDITYRVRPGGEEVIVLVHGNMTSSKHWDLLIEALPSDYTIYAPDLRGFGGSSYHEPITSIKSFSEDLADWLQQLGLTRFHLAGWSLGGAVVMQYTIDHPEAVASLILLASASSRGYPFVQYLDPDDLTKVRRLTTKEEIQQDPLRTQHIQGLYDNKDREGLKAVWNAGIYTHKQPDETRYEAYVDDMLTQRNLADVYSALNTFNISTVSNEAAQGTGEIDAIKAPVLIISGDRDLIVPQQMTDELVSDFNSRAKHVQLTDAGHSPLVDQLDELVRVMDAFIKEEK